MAKDKLSAAFVKKVAAPGVYCDGSGLNLQVTIGARGVNKSWLFRYSLRGHPRAMGLGTYPAVSLVDARAARDEWRLVLKRGLDPIAARDKEPEPSSVVTFGDCAEEYLSAHESGWRNAKHRAQWRTTLEVHAKALWHVPVDEVGVEPILAVLGPLWRDKRATASRLRGRIEAVLDAAKAKGHRSGDNPARWRGNLEHLLAKNTKIARHHPALDYREIADFMKDLRGKGGFGARALEFTILTAARTGEVIGAEWPEFHNAIWTVPASRMKSGRVHRVPLSSAAIAILESMPRFSRDPRIFRIGAMAMFKLLRRMNRGNITTHGFRSTFRDWAGDETNFPREIIEAALAHATGNAADAAYRRSDALEKRRKLMDDWAVFCERPSNVVPFARGA